MKQNIENVEKKIDKLLLNPLKVADQMFKTGLNEIEAKRYNAEKTFITVSEDIMPVAQDSNVPEELSFNINDLVPFESTITQNSASANVNQSKDPLCTSTASTRKSSRSTRVPGRFAD